MKMVLAPVVLAIAVSSFAAVPANAKPTGVPIHPSARCAVFWSAMTRAVPQNSTPYAQMTARKEAWLAHASAAIGATKANKILNADGPYYGGLVREMAGDAAALQAFAANYSECEKTPAEASPAVGISAPAANAKAPPTVTAKDKQNGERALRCAGMARMNEDMDNLIAVQLYGKLSDYLPIVSHFRPDLSDTEIKSALMSAQQEYAKLIVRDKSARTASTMAGQKWDIEKSEGVILSRECAQMANVMSRFIKK